MAEHFYVIVGGCLGGSRENNLSNYLLSPIGTDEWISLDGGSLIAGIDEALRKNNLDMVVFSDPTREKSAEMLQKIRAYLITHSHLDHILGMVINSIIDSPKPILGIDATIDNLRDYIFNGEIWPNYGNEGKNPLPGHYHYVRLPLHEMQPIENTSMQVEAHFLCHPKDHPSSAFLIEHQGHYVLYMVDTSSDELEKARHLTNIWRRIAPLIKENKLKAIIIECSAPNSDVKQVTYGHLNPTLLQKELDHLAEISETRLEGLKVIVNHRKDCLRKNEDMIGQVAEELLAGNSLDLEYVFPEQGDKIIV